MNYLYFACCDCKIYIDAGYRWVYWNLEEPGIVTRGEKVNVDSIIAAETYWNPPADKNPSWLQEIFPPLREFLRDHRSHRIVFGEEQDFASLDGEYFDWMQIGYLLVPTPRYLVEVLGFTSWAQVLEYMEKQKTPPAWWEVTWNGETSPHERGRQKFEELVNQKTAAPAHRDGPYTGTPTDDVMLSTEKRITHEELKEQQERLCAEFECECVPVNPSSKLGFALHTRDRVPMNGLRHPPQRDTNGWYLWGGEDFPIADDAFTPLHVVHLPDYCPQVIKFLGLPPGYKFLVAGDYVDVWFDSSLLSV